MSYCCPHCSFTTQFENALIMHCQLYHETSAVEDCPEISTQLSKEKSNVMPRVSPPSTPFSRKSNKGFRLPSRTSSATRLLSRLKARISKSRTLFAHAEVPDIANNLSVLSDCTSKDMKKIESRSSIIAGIEDQKETFVCHLCPFEADRITVLDRHLLNDHKIGLENLLKLVMSKTTDRLTDKHDPTMFTLKQPYYRPQDEIIEEGEFIIETVAPKIKILKHASTNTEDVNKDFSLEKNCEVIGKEIESLIRGEKDCDNKDFLAKMQILHECMSKFVNSSDALKKVLSKEFDEKISKAHYSGQSISNLGVGEPETSRNWERGTHSEKIERSRSRHIENGRTEKSKTSAESFYF